MSNRFDDFSRVPRTPTTARPLLGITVLIVEDSRYACEAVRLMCQKSGARIRRAASFKAALRHLSCYRPSVVIADMGLPDGSGVDLIGKLAQTRGRDMVLLGTSTNDEAAKAFEQAGADGFLPKPVDQQKLLAFFGELLNLEWLYEEVQQETEKMALCQDQQGFVLCY